MLISARLPEPMRSETRAAVRAMLSGQRARGTFSTGAWGNAKTIVTSAENREARVAEEKRLYPNGWHDRPLP